jgi:uncharacterized protein involved in exopolysaccharide biosynthesis
MAKKELDFNFNYIINIFKRRKKVFYITFFIVMIATVAYLFIAPIKYKAKMVVEYTAGDSSNSSSIGSLASMATLAGVSGGVSNIANEIEKIKSGPVLTKIVEELDMVNKANNNKSLYAKLRGIEFTTEHMINGLLENLNISNIKETNLIEIKYESKSQEESARIVNLIYNYYMQINKENYIKESEEYSKVLQESFNQISSQYEDINKKLIDYQTKNKIDISAQQDPMIEYYAQAYMNLIKLDSEKSNLEMKKQSIENNLYELDPKTKEFILENTNVNSTINSIKSNIVQKQIQLETLKLTTPNAPQIGILEAEIKAAQKKLQETTTQILSDDLKYLAVVDKNKYEEYIQTKTQLELFDTLKESSEKMLNIIDNEISSKSPLLYKYFLLRKDKTILELKYTGLLNALEQENLKRTFYKPKLKIVTDVSIPQIPFSPNKKLTVVLGFLLGIIFGIIMVIFKENTDKNIKSKNEFEGLFRSSDIILNNIEDSRKIFNYIYKNNYKKLGIILTNPTSEQNRISDKLYNMLNQFNNNIVYLKPEENQDLKQDINNYENFKKSEYGLIHFKKYDSSDYILYNELLDKKILLIQEEKTDIEEIENILDKEKNIVTVYIKK